MEILTVDILGKNGVAFLIGLVVFLAVGANSEKLFSWIEEQTFGTRTYLMERFELMFIKIDSQKITYGLLGLAFIPSILFFCLFAIFGNFFWGTFFAILFCILGWKLPRPVMNYFVQKRITDYKLQMVDALMLLANAIRAGQAMPQALNLVVGQLKPPIAQEFQKILQDNRLGMPIEECFEKLAERMPTEDNRMFATSFSILNEMGGNLPETFDTIVDIIRERLRIDLKIRAMMAQGRSQGLMTVSIPFVLFMIMYSTDPDSVGLLFTNPFGIVLLIIALGLIGTGAYVLQKILTVKV